MKELPSNPLLQFNLGNVKTNQLSQNRVTLRQGTEPTRALTGIGMEKVNLRWEIKEYRRGGESHRWGGG